MRYLLISIWILLSIPVHATYRLAYLEKPEHVASITESETLSGCLGLFEFKLQSVLEQKQYGSWKKKSALEQQKVLHSLYEERAVLQRRLNTISGTDWDKVNLSWGAEDYSFIISSPKVLNINEIAKRCHQVLSDTKKRLTSSDWSAIEKEITLQLGQ